MSTMGSSPESSSIRCSTISSTSDLVTNTDPALVKYVKDKLRSRIFLGRYVERRLVDKRLGYRDIVVLSPAETELSKDLLKVQHKLLSAHKMSWIGITDASILDCGTGLCLWTDIQDMPFGVFWFQIKTVQFTQYEISIKVKCLRHITEAFMEIEPILTGTLKLNTSKVHNEPTESVNETLAEIKSTLKSALSINSIKDFFTFIFALLIAVFTGSTEFINFLGIFVLALVKETSVLVRNSTPLLLGFLDFLSKIVGGFYILLAMVFRQTVPAPSQRISQRTVSYDNDHDFDPRYID